jgi:AcrR family transcriptional regulator
MADVEVNAVANDVRRPSLARERLLATASALFYADGIRGVGVDRILNEASVTRATFYRHFASKEDLVTAYLHERDQVIRRQFAAASTLGLEPRVLFDLVVQTIGEELCTAGFRGCPFINAAAEYPDPASGASRIVHAHRAWFLAAIEQLLHAVGVADPHATAKEVVLTRDGAMVAGYLSDPSEARATLVRTVESVLQGSLTRSSKTRTPAKT